MATDTLSPQQASALLDILTHAETYGEIRGFREPTSLDHYGPPFNADSHIPSTTPALQALVSRFLLPLPGLRDLTSDFWKVQVSTIINDLEKADLSESYDKGLLGSRKTLATAVSALIEYPVRGTFAGFDKREDPRHQYDLHNADDLAQSFRDFMQEVVYGHILEETVAKAAETDKLGEHELIVQAVHEYVLVNLASLMHFTLVLSPKGQYLLKLVDYANKLVPWLMIRQTLKIGNVASMINAMMKVILAKMSVASLTNWIGLTSHEDDGMNLIQHIISTVLHWDIRELESRASKLERERADPGKKQLHALKSYTARSYEEHNVLRSMSQQTSKSIVTVILEDAQLEHELTEPHHKHALEYLSIQLSIHDRKQIINVLCHSHPDHLTQSIKELVAAYEPVIRNVHSAVDLSGTVGDFENWLRDLIKIGRVQTGKDTKSTVPTVGDFVQLLKKHQGSCHKFIHQLCKNGKEVTKWYVEWCHMAAAQFRRKEEVREGDGAGDLTRSLNDLFDSMPQTKREKMLPLIDQQSRYSAEMHEQSRSRLEAVLNSAPSVHPGISKILSNHFSRPNSRSSSPAPSDRDSDERADTVPKLKSDPGPGAYLGKWQDLLDSTLITPLTAEGPVRRAGVDADVENSAQDVDGEKLIEFPEPGQRKVDAGKKTSKPDVSLILDEMLPAFRKILARKSCIW